MSEAVKYIVYDIKDNEYEVFSDKVLVDDSGYTFYKDGSTVARFERLACIGFTTEAPDVS